MLIGLYLWANFHPPKMEIVLFLILLAMPNQYTGKPKMCKKVKKIVINMAESGTQKKSIF